MSYKSRICMYCIQGGDCRTEDAERYEKINYLAISTSYENDY